MHTPLGFAESTHISNAMPASGTVVSPQAMPFTTAWFVQPKAGLQPSVVQTFRSLQLRL
jgi:hypothetical protein